jgi:hypothetical protein
MNEYLKLLKLPSCWSISLAHKNAEKKVIEKHKAHSGTQKAKSSMRIRRINFDMMKRSKAQLNPNPKPNNIWNQMWEKGAGGCQV